MIVKKHISHDGRIVVAICDSEISGKRFEEGNKQLDLSSDFYKGEEKTVEETLGMIEDANILNIVGERSIKFAMDNEMISEDNILMISGIPFAQPYLRE